MHWQRGKCPRLSSNPRCCINRPYCILSWLAVMQRNPSGPVRAEPVWLSCRSSVFTRNGEKRLSGTATALFSKKSRAARNELHRRSDPTSASRRHTAEDGLGQNHQRMSVDSRACRESSGSMPE